MADAKISALPAASTPLGGTDLVPVVQGGVTKQASVDALRGGDTLNNQAAAGAVQMTDLLPIWQGTAILKLTMTAMWNWIASQLPGYAAAKTDLSANTTLDATHMGKLLRATAAITITCNPTAMGAGRAVTIINRHSAAITVASAFNRQGHTTIVAGGIASIVVYDNGGSLVAHMQGDTA